MAVNKVIYGDSTLIDITDSTVDAEHLMSGYTAYDASGQKITGAATIPEQIMVVTVNIAYDEVSDEPVGIADKTVAEIGEAFENSIPIICYCQGTPYYHTETAYGDNDGEYEFIFFSHAAFQTISINNTDDSEKDTVNFRAYSYCASMDEIEEMCDALELYSSVIWNTDYEEETT